MMKKIKSIISWVFPSLFRPSLVEKPPAPRDDDNLNGERNLRLIELVSAGMRAEKIEEGYQINQEVAFLFKDSKMFDEMRKWTISRMEKIKSNLLDAKPEEIVGLQIKAKTLLMPFMHIAEQASKEKAKQDEIKVREIRDKRKVEEV